jgi:tetratricopeptide (TPR) repeat protein
MNKLSLTVLAGASVMAAICATQSAFADQLSEMAALKKACSGGSGQAQINACTQMIQSKFFKGAPVLSEAFYFRGGAFLHLGQYQRAVDDNAQAIARKPDFVEAYSARGLSYLFLQQPQPALQDFSKVIALKPKPEAVNFTSRGLAYSQLQQYKQAIPDFDRGIALEPTSVTYNNRGYCYFQLGQFKRAIEDYDRAIALTPGSAGVLYMRGIAKLRSDDKSGGNADIAAAVALEPKIAEQYAAAGVKP